MNIFMLFFFAVAVIITFYLKFPQFKALKIVSKSKNKKSRQTFYLSLATNIGVGNLVGVSAAIFIGGPGVIFWMAVFAFFASALSYFENYYAIKSQVKIEDVCFSGTPYTISKYYNGKFKKQVSLIFALFLVLTNTVFFPPIQINAIVLLFNSDWKLIFSIILIISISLIILKGIKAILKITDSLLPIFAILYFVFLIIGILYKISELNDVLYNILKNAFNLRTIGTSAFWSMMNVAISKSLFSHEAGLGTIPSLTGVSDKEEIETTCNYQLIGVFIDTVILCTMTGIFILLYSENSYDKVDMLKHSFTNFIGKNGLIMYSLFIIFFGFTSVLGQYYLGENNIMFLSFQSKYKNSFWKLVYQILFIIGMIIGIFGTFKSALWLVDMGILILGTINLIVLIKIERCQKLLKNKHKIT